jgi:LysM repeat protein
MKLLNLLQLSLLSLVSGSSHEKFHRRTSSCDPSTLNTTVGTYNVKENETISEISRITNRGICDISRMNRMADAMIPLYTDEELHIPPESCQPDNSTCLIVHKPGATYFDCVKGGPHTYYTIKGDTLRYIALKLNLTLEALQSTARGDGTGFDAELEVGQFVKLPQCSPSTCSFHAMTFIYGTYKDIAEKTGATVGQIMAVNPTYNHTFVAKGEGAVITVPGNCEYTGSNITVIS